MTRGSERARDLAVLGILLAIAAALRLPGLAARGGWDSDQGVDMATLQAFVSHGVVPLLGPSTSIGNVHHGALYYYLLAPAAIPAGGTDPTAVVLLIAFFGIAAVGVIWWLARAIGGPIAGLVAGSPRRDVRNRRRFIDLHLEPEPAAARCRARARVRLAGVDDGQPPLVAGRRRRPGGRPAGTPPRHLRPAGAGNPLVPGPPTSSGSTWLGRPMGPRGARADRAWLPSAPAARAELGVRPDARGPRLPARRG